MGTLVDRLRQERRLPGTSRVDPYVRHYRIWLLPRVVTHRSAPQDRDAFVDNTVHVLAPGFRTP